MPQRHDVETQYRAKQAGSRGMGSHCWRGKATNGICNADVLSLDSSVRERIRARSRTTLTMTGQRARNRNVKRKLLTKDEK